LARKPFITGNWKLNPQSKAEAVDLARGIVATVTKDDDSLSSADVGLFVPFPFLQTVKEIVGDKVVVGAQVRQAM
jgi:triosephosphate isomerase